MGSGQTAAIRAAEGEVTRLYVYGSGCRNSSQDSAPAVANGGIEFTLVLNAGCFATPPAFLWTGDVGPLPVGTYAVTYYRATQFDSPERILAGVRTLIVGPRPDAYARTTPGTPDRSFGTDGVLHMPYPGFFGGRVRIGMQSDGRVIVSDLAYAIASSIAVSRLLYVGAIDGTFGVDGTITYPDSSFFGWPMAIAANDEILIAGRRFEPPPSQQCSQYGCLAVRRYSANGGFLAEIIPSPLADGSSATEIAALPDGRFVVAGIGGAGAWFVWRFTVDGSVDQTFGKSGKYVGPLAGLIVRIVPAADGGLWLLGTDSDINPATFVFKLTSAGLPDPFFGQGGAVFGSFARTAPKEQGGGKIVVGGADFSLLRFGADGAPDPTFGDRGVLQNPTGLALVLQDFVEQPDGKLLLVGAQYDSVTYPGGLTNFAYRPKLVRLNPEGTLDSTFGENGIASVNVLTHTGGAPPSEAMVVRRLPNGEALLALPGAVSSRELNVEILVYRFHNEDSSDRRPVTEFYHAGFDHYFMTALTSEIQALDNGVFGDWSRTGQTFNAYANAPADSTSVCRFFSAAFAPKSSHFYTPDAAECAYLKTGPIWLFEGVVFNLPVPDAAGNCPAGSNPVYRLYNSGQGGAPNHRYTTSLDIRTQMMGKGWIPEGYGPIGVIMCAPE
jgi:uncharacterized delta-60 repeat protein